MNIQRGGRPAQSRPRPRAQKPEDQQPKEPWHKKAADYLERSNDTVTPRLASLGLAAKFAIKGNEITESLHPVAKVVGIVGGGVIGGFLGYSGGELLQSVNSTVTGAVLGKDTGLAKSVVSIGLNSAAFGLVGGWTGAALHAVVATGGALELARQS